MAKLFSSHRKSLLEHMDLPINTFDTFKITTIEKIDGKSWNPCFVHGCFWATLCCFIIMYMYYSQLRDKHNLIMEEYVEKERILKNYQKGTISTHSELMKHTIVNQTAYSIMQHMTHTERVEYVYEKWLTRKHPIQNVTLYHPNYTEKLERDIFLKRQPDGMPDHVLGVRMFQAAALYGLTKMQKAKGIMQDNQDLAHYFPKLPFKIMTEYQWMKQRKGEKKNIMNIQELVYKTSLIKKTQLKEHIMLFCYCQSFKYFEHMENEIRYMFQFRPDVKDRIKRNFTYILSSINVPLTGNIVFVGIHVQRRNLFHFQTTDGVCLANASYFINAMNYFKHKYINALVLYIISSDDIKWCRINLNFTNTFFLNSLNRDEYDDLAVLTSCDHVIMSIGSFGWWAGFLCSGEVIYFKDFAVPGSKYSEQYKDLVSYYPKHWVAMPN